MWGHARCICCSGVSPSGCSTCYVQVASHGNEWIVLESCEYFPDGERKPGVPSNCECLTTGLPSLPNGSYPAYWPSSSGLLVQCALT